MLWRSLRYTCLYMFKQLIWSNKFVLIFPIKILRNATPKETLLPSVPTCLDYCYFMSRHSVWLESPDYCHCCRCHCRCRCLSMALSLSQFLNIVNNSTSELKLEHIENMSMLHGTAVLQRELTRRDVSFVIVGVSKCLCLAFQSVVVGWCLSADVFSSCQLTDIIFFLTVTHLWPTLKIYWNSHVFSLCLFWRDTWTYMASFEILSKIYQATFI